jgi:hypothetical protein
VPALLCGDQKNTIANISKQKIGRNRSMEQPKRKLTVNMTELEVAFESFDEIMQVLFYLDLESGEVVMTTEEDRNNLQEAYDTYADPETGQIDWPAVLPQLDLPDWQKQTLMIADQVEAGFGERYITVPHDDSREGYNDMVAFIEMITNPRLQNRLERAISGKGAFRYFKDVLLDYPKERERWFEFRNERLRQRMLDWLDSEGIEPV